MKYLLAILFICIIKLESMQAQNTCCPYIYSINILPANPMPNDSITIITTGATPALGNKIFYTYTKQADTLNLVGCYWSGFLQALAYFADTTTIAPLPIGTYYINFTAYMSNSATTCNVTDSNSLVKVFTVGAPNAAINLNSKDNLLSISPNPFTEQSIIKTKHYMQNATLLVSNFYGETLLKLNNQNGNAITIQRNNLAPGLYFVRLLQDNKQIALEKLIIKD